MGEGWGRDPGPAPSPPTTPSPGPFPPTPAASGLGSFPPKPTLWVCLARVHLPPFPTRLPPSQLLAGSSSSRGHRHHVPPQLLLEPGGGALTTVMAGGDRVLCLAPPPLLLGSGEGVNGPAPPTLAPAALGLGPCPPPSGLLSVCGSSSSGALPAFPIMPPYPPPLAFVRAWQLYPPPPLPLLQGRKGARSLPLAPSPVSQP